MAPAITASIQWALPMVSAEIAASWGDLKRRRKLAQSVRNLDRTTRILEAMADLIKNKAEKKDIELKIAELRKAKVQIIYRN